MKMKALLILTSTILSWLSLASSWAQPTTGSGEPYFCRPEVLDALPIQQGGRVKPLYVHANEVIKYLSGASKVGSYSATQGYCLLSLEALGLKHSLTLQTVLEHNEAKKLLNLNEQEKRFAYNDLIPLVPQIRMHYQQIAEENSLKKTLGQLLQQVQLYQEITGGQNWMLPEAVESNVTWVPLTSFLNENKIQQAAQISAAPFEYVLAKAATQYQTAVGDQHLLELKYAKARLPLWAFVVTLLAIGLLVGFKRFHWALGATFLTVLIQTIYIALRVMISGRAPITNMYETVLFSGYGSLILGLIIGHYRQEKMFVFIGLIYNLCTLMMINFAGGMLSSSIGPLVPVLRDNFWLSTHVTTIILSYGALALSWILANTVLIKRRFGQVSSQDERYYSDLIYTCLKYGTTMLAAGIILGGVWADYSWGRFWGWDPKETWSLIVLCVYMAILHGKYTSWIPTHRFIPLVAGAFMSVMMAWFGVNYILASGLHSYGFSEGGAIFLGSFFMIQIALLVITFKSNQQQTA